MKRERLELPTVRQFLLEQKLPSYLYHHRVKFKDIAKTQKYHSISSSVHLMMLV